MLTNLIVEAFFISETLTIKVYLNIHGDLIDP